MLKRLFGFVNTAELTGSRLYDEQTFYRAFMRDLSYCQNEAVIESPFITSNRVASLLPILKKMRSRNIRIIVNTRHPSEHGAPHMIAKHGRPSNSCNKSASMCSLRAAIIAS